MKQKPLKSRPLLKFLTDSELSKLNTKRLLGVYNSIRAVESCAKRTRASYGTCCEFCADWILSKEEYEENVIKPTKVLIDYKNKIKSLLSKREHIK
jgi:hypothetical protein